MSDVKVEKSQYIENVSDIDLDKIEKIMLDLGNCMFDAERHIILDSVDYHFFINGKWLQLNEKIDLKQYPDFCKEIIKRFSNIPANIDEERYWLVSYQKKSAVAEADTVIDMPDMEPTNEGDGNVDGSGGDFTSL